ncbi:MAG: hypothetical protein QM845_02665 [Verrucomicrobiota bacterium]|nr:hypothetical protein [Verrucomicrobiota bacterium]
MLDMTRAIETIRYVATKANYGVYPIVDADGDRCGLKRRPLRPGAARSSNPKQGDQDMGTTALVGVIRGRRVEDGIVRGNRVLPPVYTPEEIRQMRRGVRPANVERLIATCEALFDRVDEKK